MERRAEEVFAHLDDLGDGSILEGVHRGIDDGWFTGEIADAAYAFERKVNTGRRVVVGVNRFTEGDDEVPTILSIGDEVEEIQRKRLDTVKRTRDAAAVAATLDRVRADAADPSVNLMPAILEATGAYATVGEVVGALADTFGTWTERPSI
jgi:methylmalonyl-CoA mutase N-terminal domain/subunit